ncbi:MAG: hypothetical protein ACRDQ7_08975 [Haloechinothrix sp.]
MSTSKRVQSKTFVAHVRSKTFRQRPDLDLLFVVVDVTEARIAAAAAGEPSKSGRLRFYASMKPTWKHRWRNYRVGPSRLGTRVLERLDELNEVG